MRIQREEEEKRKEEGTVEGPVCNQFKPKKGKGKINTTYMAVQIELEEDEGKLKGERSRGIYLVVWS